MDEMTLKALKGSIEKWRAIVAGTGKDEHDANCPLCQAFFDTCGGCPVMEATGRSGCCSTPYDTWNDYAYKNGNKRHVFDDHSRELAQAELDFLESLLPTQA